jgi:hypothetical protein
MGYADIENLYKNQEVLLFKEVFALEKIHGTSANISWKDSNLTFFSGGEPHSKFVALFDQEALREKFLATGEPEIKVHGEAYGGKCQGMSETYGKELKFCAFDVKVGEAWLSVPQADELARSLGFEFVAYDLIPATLEALDAHRALPSVQAKRNGIVEDKVREGDVLRPPLEIRKNCGSRIVAKYKNAEFEETTKPRKVIDGAALAVLQEANAIATEWVTAMRLTHVLDALAGTHGREMKIEDTGLVIKAMLADIKKESTGEITWSAEAEKVVTRTAAVAFKSRISAVLEKI